MSIPPQYIQACEHENGCGYQFQSKKKMLISEPVEPDNEEFTGNCLEMLKGALDNEFKDILVIHNNLKEVNQQWYTQRKENLESEYKERQKKVHIQIQKQLDSVKFKRRAQLESLVYKITNLNKKTEDSEVVLGMFDFFASKIKQLFK
jgi:hypothetical protein